MSEQQRPTPPTQPQTVAASEGETQRYRGPDRRQRRTPRFSRYTFFGGRRRSGGRREGENDGAFVDQYSGRLLLAMLWIAAMNALDSFFTLLHLQSGGIELNPVANAMLESGRLGFVASKSLLIIVPLVVLTLHKNFPLARTGIWTAAGAYTVLVGYHLTLL
ncbi:MAG: hypothetical protein FJ298_07940 [Planctomycetes bacterium]|nr:hypothetical protein [Planctomycetota bacterium]